MKARWLVVLFAAAALALGSVAGCGGDDEPEKGTGKKGANRRQEEPPKAGTDKNDMGPQKELAARVAEMIKVIKGGNALEAMKAFLPPEEFAKFQKAPDFERELEKFNERKAPRLLKLLGGLDFDKAKIEGDRAEFPAGRRPLIFVKIEGKWYIKN